MLLMLQLVFIETILLAFQMDTAPVCVVGKLLIQILNMFWHLQCNC